MKEWILEFSKTPAGTAICIGAMVIVLAIVILANTSIGRKSLKKLANLIEQAKVQSKTTNANVELNAKKVENIIESYKAECEKVETHSKEIEELLLAIAKCVNNKKIQELIKAYENSKVEQLTTNNENNAE